MRVAGIEALHQAASAKQIEFHGHNFCRRQGCEFVGIRAPNNVENAVRALQEADVVVVAAQLLEGIRSRSALDALVPPRETEDRPVRILYWREGGWSIPEWVQEVFDFTMGVHTTSSIMNPSFFPRPILFNELDRSLGLTSGKALSTPPSFESRKHLAYAMITNCNQEPRSSYLAVLKSLINVHEYGNCGPGKVPYDSEEKKLRWKLKTASSLSRHDVNAMAHYAVAKHYKFYLAFENTIAEGYVTEKLLLSPIMSGIVPVYMGAPDLRQRLPSLDGKGRPWYIDVLDYDTPQELAAHLQHVAANRTLWESYGAWRGHLKEMGEVAKSDGEPSAFPLFPRAPRPVREAMNDSLLLSHITTGAAHRLPLKRRVATICRLCDLGYVRSLPSRTTIAPPIKAMELGCLFQANCTCRGGPDMCVQTLNTTWLKRLRSSVGGARTSESAPPPPPPPKKGGDANPKKKKTKPKTPPKALLAKRGTPPRAKRRKPAA
ncbi:hypothetical protein CTAYLR_000806 [Chrysophaeum taylorii]|uniref:Fucosyltransferase n=1 Tax=Chrysophaeum taylorii TaxID=2483200 RepID=A0AAD7URM0_9STRA|nr:hypothetical protein CTAYLR_000806 [Chrysophaeum taylorii]